MKNLSPEEIAQLCLDSFEEARPYLSLDVIIALKHLVRKQSYSDPKQALKMAEIALEAAGLVEDDDQQAVAWATWAKGMALGDSQYPQKALPFYRQAEIIFSEHEQWLPLVELQTGLVYVLIRCGEVGNALKLAEEVRPHCRRLGKDGLKALGLLEMNVGTLYKQQGQFDLALQANERAMQAYTQAGAEFEIARIKINSANVCQEMDNYRQAEILYNEAHQILLRVAPERQELYIIDFNLGLQAEKLGRYQQALRHLEQASDGLIPEAHIALVDIHRADIYNQLNLSQEALVLARDAARFYKQAEIPNDLAHALLIQAIAWRGLGQLEMSHRCLLEARQIFTVHNSQRNIARIDFILAELALENHEIEQARQLTNKLANRVEKNLWPNLASEIYLLQARILLATFRDGDSQTKPTLQNPYTMLQQALYFTKEHPQPKLMTGVYHLLSQFYITQARPQAAWSALCQAIAYLETMRANLLLDEFRMGLMDEQHGVYVDGLRLLCNPTLLDPVSDKQTQWMILFYLLNIVATAPLVQSRLGVDADSELNQQLQKLRDLWHWQQKRLENTQFAEDMAEDLMRQEIAARIAAVAETERQIADLGRRLRVRSGEYITPPKPLRPDEDKIDPDNILDDTLTIQFQEQAANFCHEIQQQLASHETLLNYFVLDEQVCLLLIDNAEILYYSLGSITSIQQFQRHWKHHLQGTHLIFNKPEVANKVAQRILAALGKVLLEPLLDRLADRNHLYLVYPAEWHEIPFAALRTTKGHLVDCFQLTHLSTPEALLQHISAPRQEPDSQPPSPSLSTPTDYNSHALILGCSEFGTLPHNLQECHQVQQTLSQSGWQTTLLLEEDATRQNFYTAASQSRLLHLATHAFFQPENPLFSWARLADSQLTVADIYHQTPFLNQTIVVLSACETGRGQVRGGGLLGMARALLVSGAQSLIASLWRVEDQATAQLMEQFYQQIDTPHKPITSHHLCQAQRNLAATRHPFFWAGFVYIGG